MASIGVTVYRVENQNGTVYTSGRGNSFYTTIGGAKIAANIANKGERRWDAYRVKQGEEPRNVQWAPVEYILVKVNG